MLNNLGDILIDFPAQRIAALEAELRVVGERVSDTASVTAQLTEARAAIEQLTQDMHGLQQQVSRLSLDNAALSTQIGVLKSSVQGFDAASKQCETQRRNIRWLWDTVRPFENRILVLEQVTYSIPLALFSTTDRKPGGYAVPALMCS